MSDTSQGPGWWLASDGRWYPPELWTGPPQTGTIPPRSATPAYPSTPTGASSESSDPAQMQTPYGQAWAYPGQATPYPGPPASYPGQPAGSAYPAYAQYPPQGYSPYAPLGAQMRHTNGLAVASLVCACGGFLFFIPAVIGIILGFVARGQIRQSAGRQTGDGLALAGIIVGFAWIALFVILVAVGVANRNTTNGALDLPAAFALAGLIL
jgi:hypothetical protein